MKPRSGAVAFSSLQPDTAPAQIITVANKYRFKPTSLNYSGIQILGIRAVKPVRIS